MLIYRFCKAFYTLPAEQSSPHTLSGKGNTVLNFLVFPILEIFIHTILTKAI